MNRRAFITLLGSAAVWPLAARAEQPLPVVAFINVGSPETRSDRVAAFRKGLSETGYIEGQNVSIEYHWLDGAYLRLPAVLDGVIQRRVGVIAIPGSGPAF
jgi:putative ABC transport system substrate-binding protein